MVLKPPKPGFAAKLKRDPRQRAEIYQREGRTQKAAEMYALAGDLRKAARLAVEAGDERLAVECALKAVFGTVPPELTAGGGPLRAVPAAEYLVARGHHDEAIGLFELAHAFRRAAASALALGQAARAGRLFERGRALWEAAQQYENAELLDDALRVLELEARRLSGQGEPGRPPAANQEQLARIGLRRAEVLRKLGKEAEAAALLRDVRPTTQGVRLLADSGKYREAIEAALQMGDTEAAVRLLQRSPNIDRRLAAQIYLRSGHAVEAGNVFAAAGLAREAAEAYEAGGDWAKAGSRWETAQEHERAAEAYLRASRPRDAGRCYAALGKHALAAAAYAKAGDPLAAADQYLKAKQRVAAATQLLAAGERGKAAQALMQVAAGSAEHEAAMLQLAPLLLAEGKAEEALRRLGQLPQARPSTLVHARSGERFQVACERLYLLGRSYEQLGKLDHAAACFKELADPSIQYQDAAERLATVRRRQEPDTAATRVTPFPPMPGLTARPTAAAPTMAVAFDGAALGAGTAARPGAGTRPGAVDPPPTHATGLFASDELDVRSVAPPGASRSRQVTAADAAGGQTGAIPAGGTGAGEAAGAAGADARPSRPRGPGRPIGTLSVGQMLAGRFQILAELGQGGMGRVYKAQDIELGEPVAIKMLLSHHEDGSVDVERLLREVQICRKITHPNVVRVFDLGRHGEWIFIIMELLEGEVLADLIDPDRRLPLDRIKTILTEIASGLGEAHALGVVHRDLKPENVILTATRLKILDFGIARMSGFENKRLTQAGFALGSPLYMSPEQIQGLAIDGRSDIYSLGVLAFALLAGREPFDGANSTAIAIQHLQQPPPSLLSLRPGLPQAWSDLVIDKLLAKRPEDRCATTGDVIAALAPLPVA